MATQLLFSVAGARGIVGETIDEDVVARLTRAYCSVLPDGPIAVGRDTRPSGASFIEAVTDAVTSSGRDVIHLGIATTPTVELVTEKSDAVAGIIVTASHNPVQWNALKFLDHRGIFITRDVSEKLLAAYESGDAAPSRSKGSVRTYQGAAEEHIDAILKLDVIDVERITAAKLTVVVDCINGAGSVIAPELLYRLGARVIQLNCSPNGNFYRDPEPRPENLADLTACVRKSAADLGLATDPDADRLALVSGGVDGEPISEEYTLALAAEVILKKHPGNLVVNLSTSAWIDHVAGAYGVSVERTPVGEAHVVARMLGDGAVAGGEGNGGVIYPALHPGRDAMLGMALILQLLADRGVPLADIVREYPPLLIRKDKVPLGGAFSAERISQALRPSDPATIDTQDGVKATFADGWVHLRVSNTEGIVRVITEAPDAGRVETLQKIARDALDASW
jgi:phosphomannomutase